LVSGAYRNPSAEGTAAERIAMQLEYALLLDGQIDVKFTQEQNDLLPNLSRCAVALRGARVPALGHPGRMRVWSAGQAVLEL